MLREHKADRVGDRRALSSPPLRECISLEAYPSPVFIASKSSALRECILTKDCSIGPATSPSFESDPRITLENNFYYPQEDLLDAYCKEAGLHWNVMRPSYIIGAVRDNLLNNMVGIAIYASVCAHLKEPLAFPGDYAGWDREHCQSTAMLNSYFYEWTVFNPDAGNEAFNVQDGLPFTWGRFWQYLAGWYGLQWTPPEADESKYRVVESRHAATPRG